MAKVVVSGKGQTRVVSKRGKALASKRVRDSDGQLKTLLSLDFGSDTFGRDLQYAFAKNVTKARRENKRIVGSADLGRAKR